MCASAQGHTVCCTGEREELSHHTYKHPTSGQISLLCRILIKVLDIARRCARAFESPHSACRLSLWHKWRPSFSDLTETWFIPPRCSSLMCSSNKESGTVYEGPLSSFMSNISALALVAVTTRTLGPPFFNLIFLLDNADHHVKARTSAICP